MTSKQTYKSCLDSLTKAIGRRLYESSLIFSFDEHVYIGPFGLHSLEID